jgi:cysteine-rich repeat protein
VEIMRLVDTFHTTSTTLQSGVATAISGSFQPTTPNQTASFSLDRSLFDAGYDGTSQPGDLNVQIVADNRQTVVSYDLNDTSRSASLVQTVADLYADPFPQSVGRSFVINYGRSRMIRLPNGDVGGLIVTSQQTSPYPGPIDPGPRLQPPSGITVAGIDFNLGGKVTFDGHAPVVISWNPTTSATSYELLVTHLPEGGESSDVAVFRTTGTSLTMPAELFENGAFYILTLESIQATNNYPAGHILPFGISSEAVIVSGRLRLTASCGDGVVQPGEACDTGGESATCNVDCTLPVCGDGLHNAAAGEACDAAQDTAGCDRDCTLPVCGDGQLNFVLEDCDDGNAADDGNGCSSDCKFNNVCGNGHVEVLVEECDEGGVDTATCNSDCSASHCGDGHVNTAAGEECDDGFLDHTRCSSTCKLL